MFTIVAVIATLSLLAPSPGEQDVAYPTYVRAHKTVSDDEDEVTGEEGTGEYISDSDSNVEDLIESLDDDIAQLDEENEFHMPGQGAKGDMQKPPERTFASLQEKIIGFFKHEPEYYWIHYKLEFAMLTFGLIVCYSFIDGKNTNSQLAV